MKNSELCKGIPFDSKLKINEELVQFDDKELNTNELLEFALRNRNEIQSGNYLVQSASKKVELNQLERIPNPMIGGFVQRDGFQENVVGARLSIPLRVWRDQSGELEESRALQSQSESNLEISKHSIQLEVLKAISNLRTIREERIQFPMDLLGRSDESLKNIKKAVTQGQLSLRDALISQTSLISLKVLYLQMQLDHSLANIELIRSTGLPILEYNFAND